ncbi:MAG: Lon protease [candidate division TM6 bacterium GW2011_GWF2_37_49]|nr:MAG: Lon protease [candidate division TM6 bacterium GW2011_GWF2_37_49]
METNKKELFDESIPQQIPVIPTIDVVVFPHMVVPLLILDDKIINGIELAQKGSNKVLLLAARQPNEGYVGPIGIQDLYKTGTVGNIMRVMEMPEGGLKVLVQGLVKVHVEDISTEDSLLQAKIKKPSTKPIVYDKNKAENQLKGIIKLVEKLSAKGHFLGIDLNSVTTHIQDPEYAANFILSHLNLNVSQAQTLLEIDNLNDLLECLESSITNEIEVSSVQDKIQSDARESINRSQREYYLREQLRAIQKELGDDPENELEAIKKSILEKMLPDEVKAEATRQVRRLEKTPQDSMEATVIRNHLEWLLEMPWNVHTKDNTDIVKAKEILNSNHHGLEETKERVLDFLSIKFLKDDCPTPILCLFGPPGVGKTSLGRSIAESLGRKYARISLGGVYDECEIRGHRRTYVGALPGRFIQAVRKSGSINPVIIVDEIDKIGMSNRGDPSAALLEVLDPEQNSAFYDNYLGISFDMSKVMFVTTANDLSTIPGPLRDRMEIIQISGYVHEEKTEIAHKHLLPKALRESGLDGKGFELNKTVLSSIAYNYTREAGVRELERVIKKLCSKYARCLVESNKKLKFTTENLHEYLGPRKTPSDNLKHLNKIGVSNGLAWTPFGGEVLQIEAVMMKGSGKLLLTGQLGDVMKESAQAAVTYAKSHAPQFGLKPECFTDYDLHIHIPAGAIPKDGPSAGITLLSSILSAYTGRAINGTYAMTGEINLQGNVMPIGGLKEKILAAKQNGLKNIIIPRENERDLVGLDKLFKGLKLFFVDDVQEVLKHVLMPN